MLDATYARNSAKGQSDPESKEAQVTGKREMNDCRALQERVVCCMSYAAAVAAVAAMVAAAATTITATAVGQAGRRWRRQRR